MAGGLSCHSSVSTCVTLLQYLKDTLHLPDAQFREITCTEETGMPLTYLIALRTRAGIRI